MELSLDMYQTVALAVIFYFLGCYIRKNVSFFSKFCIPAPVIGGLIFALINLGLRTSGVLVLNLTDTLQSVFMTVFFCSIGFTASFRLLKKGGVQVFIFLAVAIVLVVLQNVLAVLLAGVFNLDPLLGLCTGSIPMVGGHGTAGSFGPLFENDLGVLGANTVAIAAATFGLIGGSLIGGPIANRLIVKRGLKPVCNQYSEQEETVLEEVLPEVHEVDTDRFMNAIAILFIAMGIGSIVYNFFKSINLTFPTYIGAMLIGALIRNVCDLKKMSLPEREIEVCGSVGLSVFLAMALMSLRLWELAALALPLVVMLLAQTLLMAVYATFVTFNVMGRDYEAAVLAAANCGFGMGATPNAMANMQSVSSKFGPAPKAFFIVPLVGSLFIDFFNSGILTIFINVLH